MQQSILWQIWNESSSRFHLLPSEIMNVIIYFHVENHILDQFEIFINNVYNINILEEGYIINYGRIIGNMSDELLLHLRKHNYLLEISNINRELIYKEIINNNKAFIVPYGDDIEYFSESKIKEGDLTATFYRHNYSNDPYIIYKSNREILRPPSTLIKWIKDGIIDLSKIINRHIGVVTQVDNNTSIHCVEFQDYVPIYEVDNEYIIALNCNINSHKYGTFGIYCYMEEDTAAYIVNIHIDDFVKVKINNEIYSNVQDFDSEDIIHHMQLFQSYVNTKKLI